MTTMVADTRAVFQREMSLVLRDPFSVIFSLVQPLVFLGLFGPLLAGSVAVLPCASLAAAVGHLTGRTPIEPLRAPAAAPADDPVRQLPDWRT